MRLHPLVRPLSGAEAAVIAFSTTDRASFDAVPSWRRKVTAECGDIAMALVQNKVDLLDRWGGPLRPVAGQGWNRLG
jgi:GTPase SAR1 family protein